MMQVPDLPHPVTGVLLAATAWTYYSKGEPALIAISFTGPAVLSLVVLPILSGLQQARWANRGRALMAMAFALCGLAYAWDAHQVREAGNVHVPQPGFFTGTSLSHRHWALYASSPASPCDPQAELPDPQPCCCSLLTCRASHLSRCSGVAGCTPSCRCSHLTQAR